MSKLVRVAMNKKDATDYRRKQVYENMISFLLAERRKVDKQIKSVRKKMLQAQERSAYRRRQPAATPTPEKERGKP